MLYRICLGASLLGCTLMFAGCGAVVRTVAETAIKREITTDGRQSSPSVDTAYVNSLAPVNSGSGLIVFEPQAQAKNAKLAAGLGRWLHFHVAGQGELGKTPPLLFIDELRRQFDQPNLALGLADAQKLAKSAGVTHFAIGQLSESNGKLKLAYQVFPINAAKPAFTVSREAAVSGLVGQLPQMSREMATKLGVKKAIIPAQVALSSSEVAVLGQLPMWYGRKADSISEADLDALAGLASKEAAAGAFAFSCGVNTGEAAEALATEFIRRAPENGIGYAAVSLGNGVFLNEQENDLRDLVRKFPRNFLLNHALNRHLDMSERAEQLKWGEAATRCATKSPYSWRYLSVTQSSAAQQLRKGRWAKDVNSSEWQTLYLHYGRSQAAALKAIEIDPDYSFGWSRLANAATFNSDRSTAVEALNKALELEPTNNYAWEWGWEMMQPKWGGTKQEFAQYAMRAAENSRHSDIYVGDLGIQSVGMPKEEQRKILEVFVKNDPLNVSALHRLGQQYHHFDRNYPRAEQLYRQALAANPNDGDSNSALGDITYWVHGDAKTAEALYRKAITAEPENGYFYANLGRLLALTDRMAEGKAMAMKAKEAGFTGDHPVWEATGVGP